MYIVLYEVSIVKTAFWTDLHFTEEGITGNIWRLSVDVDCTTGIIIPPATGICLSTVVTARMIIIDIWSAELYSIKGFEMVCPF